MQLRLVNLKPRNAGLFDALYVKVPVRQPLVLVKALSSLVVLSNVRILLGAGLSPWKEDFIFNGIAFESLESAWMIA